LEPLASLTRVDACNPLLQAHPTWARDEHEGRGIPTSLTPVSGRLLASPPSRSPSRSTHLGWGTRRHSLVGPRDPPVSEHRQREYLLLGPSQQKGHIFPKKQIGDRQRSFQESWFKKHEWLEYSVAKDAAFCFYCFLFKQPRRENFGVESYTGATGYNNWKNAIKSFDVHVRGIPWVTEKDIIG
jgi:hypothetical protein